MILSRVTVDDLGVICNYVIDELQTLGGTDTYGMSTRVEAALKDSEAWKVETDDEMIIAFGAVEIVSSTRLHVLSYYIARQYRQTKAAYLITKKMVELMEPYSKITYTPLNSAFLNKFCSGSTIDKQALKKFVERFDKRWEVALKSEPIMT